MSLASPIFALGFGSLAMLGWLAAAAVPVLIHLWSRRNYRETPWAAVEYLLAAMKQSARRLRLEQLLLLLVRMLIIVLTVFAVAEPALEESRQVFTAGERTHRVLVIDASYSMAYEATDQSRFQRAKEIAARIIGQGAQGDGFTLLLMANPPRAVVPVPALKPSASQSPEGLAAKLENLSLSHGAANLPATLAKVEDILEMARLEHPGLTREEVVFITDLGRAGWSSDKTDAAWAEFLPRSRRLAKRATLVVVDVGQANGENAAVTDVHVTTKVRAAAPFASPGQDVSIQATLENFGQNSRQGQLVKLLVDGFPVKNERGEYKQERVNIGPDQPRTVTFSHRFDEPGDRVVEIVLQSDALELDNRRRLVLPVKPFLNVLCVDGGISGATSESAVDNLVVALESSQDSANRPRAKVKSVPAAELWEQSLGDFDCIFLANVPRFTSSQAWVLESYLKSGGSLVFFLGDRVLAERYNWELSGEDPDGVRVLPCHLRLGITTTAARSPYLINALGYRHPILKAFEDQEQAGLLSTPIRTYFKTALPKLEELDGKLKNRLEKEIGREFEDPQGLLGSLEEGLQEALVATIGPGDPLIVAEPIHRGRSILVTTSADVSWTAMPAWPSFVPLVQETLAYAVGGQLNERNLLVGQLLQASVPARADEVSVVVQPPNPGGKEDGDNQADGNQVPRPDVTLQPIGDYTSWTCAQTATSGIYSAQVNYTRADGGTRLLDEKFAVNLDTTESDLTKLTAAELRQNVWPEVPFVHGTTWEGFDSPSQERTIRDGKLDKGLLYLVLALLLVELFMAWRFAHHTP